MSESRVWLSSSIYVALLEEDASSVPFGRISLMGTGIEISRVPIVFGCLSCILKY